jgi:hypothetical protein
MAAKVWVKNTLSTWSEAKIYVKTALATWQPITNLWVKDTLSTWQSAYSSTFQIEKTVEAKIDLSSGSATYSNNDLAKVYGTMYHVSPTPTSISYNFKLLNSYGTTYTLASGTSLSNPATGASSRVPAGTNTYAATIPQAGTAAMGRGGDNFITFSITATDSNGQSYQSTGSYTLRTPAKPTVTIDTTYQVSNSIRINWAAASQDDYFATGRYLVYYQDLNTGTYTYGSSSSTDGTGGYVGSYYGTATITGLNNSHTYSFYVIPITGSQGYNPNNYSGYLGAAGGVTTGTTLAPLSGRTPQPMGDTFPGGTVYIEEYSANWSITPTSYTYQWQKSTDYQTYVNMPGYTTRSITVPTDFITNGNYIALRCVVIAYYNSIPSDPTNSYPVTIQSRTLATPVLSVYNVGFSVYPTGYATIHIDNYDTAYSNTESWTASISPNTTISKNQEFPYEWIADNLTPGTTYTVTIYVAKTNFTTASASIQFTALPKYAGVPQFSTYFGSTSSQGFIAVYSSDAARIDWQVWRSANGTGVSGHGNSNTYTLFDSGTAYGTGYFYYDLPRNGYYYMTATGYNSSNNTLGGATSNSGGQTGVAQNWFYTGSPNAPSAGTASVSGTDAYLTWSPYVDTFNQTMGASILNNVQSYQIYWLPTYSPPANTVTPDYTGLTGSSYTATIGTPTTRHYWIRSYTNSGNIADTSAWVYLGSVTIAAVAPTAPTSLTATGTANGVDLSWSGATGTITNYGIWYSGSATGNPSTSSTPDFTSTTTTYSDTAITQGSTRYYWVRAQGPGGNSAWYPAGNGVSGTRVANATAPTSVSVSVSGNVFTVSWSGATNATQYHIYWLSSSGSSTTTNPATGYDAATTNTSYDFTLSYSSSYYFYVSAANSNNVWTPYNSARSALASSGAQITIPSTPTGISATTTRTDGIYVSWNASSGATSYEVWWGGPPLDSYTPDFYPGTNTYVLDTGMGAGGSRTYYVRARNSAGASSWSGGATGTRANVVVSAPGTPSITLTYSAGPSWSGSWSATGATSYTYAFYTATNNSGAGATLVKTGTGTSMSYSGGTNIWGQLSVTATNSGGSTSATSAWT